MAVEPQRIVLRLKWTEDGQPREELFGPWTQGDPETEEGALSHMVAAGAFIREWQLATGCEPPFGDATVILVLDPDEWLRERKGQR